MIEGQAVHVEVGVVGLIERIHYLDTEDSGEIAGVSWTIGLLGAVSSAETTSLTPEGLIDGLLRVFPFDAMHEKMAREMMQMPISFAELQERNDMFRNHIEKLLTQYFATSDDEIDHRASIAKEISDLLDLETNIAGDLSSDVTRLTWSRHIARHRKCRGTERGEPVCEVRCPTCCKITLFRLDLRDTGGVGQSVYRVPGLTYSGSVKDGVGFVLENGKVTGRMLYGPPACNCQLKTTVHIV